MKRLLSLVAFFATLQASAQQVNPVPDYVFANRMSAGRNTVTDTAAYFSIGPRYGATRGMMPPMVVDTASFSANKRNGLLIFSVQKNKFLYWDSVGVKWAEMAGTGGSAITGSGVAGYMPEFTTTTNLDTTRLYHSAGRFAIGSTTTTNGVFNVYGGSTYIDTNFVVGNNALFVNEASGNIGINIASPSARLHLLQSSGDLINFVQTDSVSNAIINIQHTKPNTSGNFRHIGLNFSSPNGNTRGSIKYYISDTFNVRNYMSFFTADSSGSGNEKMRIFQNGRVYIGTTPVDNNYQLDVEGALRTLGSANFATSTGNVGIGNASPSYKTDITGTLRSTGQAYFGTSSGGVGINTTTMLTGVDAGNTSLYVVSPKTNFGAAITSVSDGVGRNILVTDSGKTNVAVYAITPTLATIGSYSNTDIRLVTNLSSRLYIFANGRIGVNTTTDAGYQFDISGSLRTTTTVTTGAPTGGSTKPWKLGEAATVSPTSPNRTIRVEIDGTVYYLHAKTTND